MKSEQPDPKKNKKVAKPEVKPKARPKRTAKRKLTEKINIVEDINVTEKMDIPAYVHDAIKQAFLRYYDKASIKKAQDYDLTHIDGILSEYLDNFILLGFDTQGQKVSLMHAGTHCGKDALLEHLRSTLIQMLGPEH
jgi:hypothetical protein